MKGKMKQQIVPKRSWKFLIALVLFLMSCQGTLEPEFRPKLVINAEFKAGYPVDSVFVSWTADITKHYDPEAQRVRGATVLLNGIPLQEYADAPGVYYLADTNFVVQTGETYQLDVFAGDEHARALTTVPPSFQFTAVDVQEGDTVHYIPGDSWFSDAFFTLEWYDYNEANIYRVLVDADSATPENFIEDDRDIATQFKGEKENRVDPSIWWVNDQFARINWMYFNFTGWHNVIVSAMDDNYYRYHQGLPLFQVNGRNFNQVVENGYGLVTSSSSDTLRIYLVAE